MSVSARENTVTNLLTTYLKKHDVDIISQAGLEIPGEWPKEPDITIENDGLFVGEAKWESSYYQGIAEARDYGLSPGVNGAIAIGYPDEIKSELQQTRLGDFAENVLSKYKYRVAFIRPEQPTEMAQIELEELPSWIDNHIHSRVKPNTDPEEVVTVLRQTANALTRRIEEVETPDLFRNVLGITPEEDEQREAAKHAAGYLLVNQVTFYRVLSSVKDTYPDIDPDGLSSTGDLQDEYFVKVLEDDYSAIFSFPVSKAFGQEHLGTIKDAVKSIYGLSPEQIDHEVLGTVFHSLTPLSVRKPVAAFYTKNKSAEILANLAIEDSGAEVLDPACGSGTLLTAAYRRKRELTDSFTEEDHRRFLKNEITGTDIMPFAAHLSTIHLALEQPAYQTDKVRIGIEDATKLSPGTQLAPLSYVLPEALTGQKSIEDFNGDMDWREETIERGSISLEGAEQDPINLDQVDVVIMNPPFSRQESVAHFSSEYKQKLKDRFSERSDYIHGKMSFSSYFIFLADKFLNPGGKIAAILPASTLNKMSDGGVREMLLNEYDLQYLITREDESNFSEDTDFREILLIAEKGKSSNQSTAMVSLNGLGINIDAIRESASSLREGEVKPSRVETKQFANGSYSVRRFPQSQLKPHNLFAPLSVRSYELFEVWSQIEENDIFTQVEKLDAWLTGGLGFSSTVPECKEAIINRSDADLHKNDIWVHERTTQDSIFASHRYLDEQMEIPAENTVKAFHRYAYRGDIDISELEEYVVHRDDFDQVERFFEVGEIESLPSSWPDLVEKRLSHLGFMQKLDLTAPGTGHLAYYTDDERVFHSMMWVLADIEQEQAKQLSIWFDSSLNLLQFLINRRPIRGSWTKYLRHMVEKFKVPDPDEFTELDKQGLELAFAEVSGEKAPSLVEQLARNISEDDLNGDSKILDVIQDGLSDQVGEGFEPRRIMDQAILDVLEVPKENQQEILDQLYPALLSELVALKRMMD